MFINTNKNLIWKKKQALLDFIADYKNCGNDSKHQSEKADKFAHYVDLRKITGVLFWFNSLAKLAKTKSKLELMIDLQVVDWFESQQSVDL